MESLAYPAFVEMRGGGVDDLEWIRISNFGNAFFSSVRKDRSTLGDRSFHP